MFCYEESCFKKFKVMGLLVFIIVYGIFAQFYGHHAQENGQNIIFM